jgi:DNA-binding SARP family transcriptional activator
LADALWGEIAPAQSKSYLRKALWQLQSALEVCGMGGILLVDREWLQVNSEFDFWLDVADFEKAFKRTQGARGRDLDEGQAQLIQRAVEIYRGDLLEGWYQDWCFHERERLQYIYIAMLDKLMDYCEAHRRYEDGLMYGEKVLHHDRARERTHRRLMRLYYASGDRTAALRQYKKCVQALREELGVEAAERTRQLHEIMRADSQLEDQFRELSTISQFLDSRENPLIAVHDLLVAFQGVLRQMQAKLNQDIQEISRVMRGSHK